MSEPSAGRTDHELLAAHVEGDPHAFGELFTRHRDRLWAVALRTTGNPEDAADALQDALIAAHRRAGSFRGDSQVTTWLHRIVVNACLDRLRRNKVRRADPLTEDHHEVPDAGPGPAEEAERDERRRAVLAALDEISADQRAALVLVDMEGYPVEEAARILECPTGTVKSRCARGRARLATLLADLAPSAPSDAVGTAAAGGASDPQADLPAGRAPPAARRPEPTPINPATQPGPPSEGGAHP